MVSCLAFSRKGRYISTLQGSSGFCLTFVRQRGKSDEGQPFPCPVRSGAREAVLQASARTLNGVQAFWPVTLEVPKVLLPLVNVPMIDYSLEWLAASRVEEVGIL